jgi:hypothetical protein
VVTNLFPGKYRIHPNYVPEGFYLADIRQGARSLYADGILTVAGEATDPVDFVFKKVVGEVLGTLQNRQGKPTTGVVALVPSMSLRGNFSLYKTTTVTATDGQFGFKDIAPGDYKIFAWENTPTSGAMQSVEYLSKYENRGRAVSVIAGIRISDVVIALIPND